MATYNKFNDYAEQLNRGVHNWGANTFKVALTNSAPSGTQTALGDITQIGTAGGYTTGGFTLDGVTLSESSGTAKVVITDEVITASGGTMGPFRYLVIYNDSATSPVDALVAWYDYSTNLSLNDGESLTLDFDPTNGFWQLV